MSIFAVPAPLRQNYCLSVIGVAAELGKLKEPLGHLNPAWFACSVERGWTGLTEFSGLAGYLRKMMSARTSQAKPTKSKMKNAVPSVVAAMLKNRECGTLFISLPMLIQSVH
jgi:hypothetical protein